MADRRGKKENNKQNFANLTPEEQRAIPKNSGGSSVSHAIQGNLTNGRNKVITPEIQQEIRENLLGTNKKTGNTYIQDYIRKFFQEAYKDPNSRSGTMLNNILFKEDLLSTLDKAVISERDEDKDFQLYKVRGTLYDRQQEVFDNNIDTRIVIINSRRSGKTELLGRLAVKNAIMNPDAHIVYINRTSSAAIRQIRGPLESALLKSNIRVVKGSVDSQELHFNTGGQMLILGNNNAADIDKLRGERISLCILDECGHQRNMRQLIREVIGPALKDYGDKAQLVIVGTPPRIPRTYVEECWNNPYWKKYHWTFLDNPFIPNRDKVIEEVCQENGCTPESAFIQREYFGRMDAFDNDSLVIKNYSFISQSQLNQVGNVVDYAYVLVDWGWEDKPAVVSAIVRNGRMYLIDCWSENHNGIAAISDVISKQYNKLKDTYTTVHPIKVIADNNEKSAVWDLYDIYKIPNVFCAYKSDKNEALEQLNDLFSSNKITVLETLKDSPLVDDLKSTVWIRDEETDKVLHTDIDDGLYHPNALMAVLYGSREFCYEALKYVDNNKQARSIVDEIRGKQQ